MSSVGVVGLGVMGSQLVLNLAEKLREPVSGFDLDSVKAKATADAAAAEFQGSPPVSTFAELAPFVASLAQPRRVLLLVPAGKPVDAAVGALQPLLAAGDVIVDLGNEWFEETQRRQAALQPTGVLFMGCGLSGGESGARHGPCLMPGGPEEGWVLLRPMLEAIAAKVPAEQPSAAKLEPCVTYIGGGGAGHYVKMVRERPRRPHGTPLPAGTPPALAHHPLHAHSPAQPSASRRLLR